MPDRPHLPRRHGSDRLPPHEEERVRRLLAEARHDEPMPDEVASRLDDVLADLAAEPRRAATVHRLADRRRRAATMLVAAAAVVLAGVSVGQLVGGSNEDAATTSSDSGLAELDRDGPATGEAGGAGEEGAAPPQADGGTLARTQRTDVVRVRVARFAVDVDRLRDRLRRPAAAQGLVRDDVSPGCDPGEWGPGTYQPVRYAGSEGYVVLRPATGDIQVADLFLCGSDQVQRSVTLPGP